MLAPTPIADDLVRDAVTAVLGGAGLAEALEALDAPIYVTDANGWVTHFNSACIGFTGRQPAAGKDRWCVTWKLYTNEGEFLPHAACPMAVAIKEKRPIRGVTAVAERPNGERVTFMPLPTPVFGPGGAFLGAINILIDVSELRQVEDLRAQAGRCERLAHSTLDRTASGALTAMAAEYQAKAEALDKASRLAALV
ncbi:MAG TPA: hypothetical protein VKT30_05090 [Caulobacteraceae bacterium]|nr:hypothetical protein [Caulobacteraceae bacterium]